jgi:exosortase J
MKKDIALVSDRRAHHESSRALRMLALITRSGRLSSLSNEYPETDVVLICLLVLVGSLALWPLWLRVGKIWANDSLRVIGAAFPFISFAGVLAALRRLGWRTEGSLWGLLPVAAALQLVQSLSIAPISYMNQSRYWLQIHNGPVLFLYGVGVTLLFGGWRLLRAAILPLCLLLCINPIPTSFNYRFDMPLQELSASTARAFAHLIGLHPTGVQLRMMFTPEFGMMIVPGCNGIRGAITLAYLALIYGYTRGLRPRTLALIGPVALLGGYGLNLLRLCILVVYYRIGLSIPSIQNYGTGVDYAIGCTVFLTATIGLGFLVRSMEPKDGQRRQPKQEPRIREVEPNEQAFALFRLLCFVALIAVPVVHARALFSSDVFHPPTEAKLIQKLPLTVGSFRLVDTYSEKQYTAGPTMLVFGDYVGPTGLDGLPRRITMGLYVAQGYHRVVDSKLIQGQKPVWTAALDVPLSSSLTVHYGMSLYDDGNKRQFNAETACTKKTCLNPLLDYERFSLSNYFRQDTGKHLPIVLRGEWPDADTLGTNARQQEFYDNVTFFTQQLDIKSLVESAGTLTE